MSKDRYDKKNLDRLVRNISEQASLALLDLQSGQESEALLCRLEFISQFAEVAKRALVPSVEPNLII